jgi:hypothetical protein
MRGEREFVQEIQNLARGLQKETQDELWEPKPDMDRLNRLLRTQADLENAICDLLGARD